MADAGDDNGADEEAEVEAVSRKREAEERVCRVRLRSWRAVGSS